MGTCQRLLLQLPVDIYCVLNETKLIFKREMVVKAPDGQGILGF